MKVFICHTTADKKSVVRPLSDILSENVECWIDENEIAWGDSVTEKVNAGIRESDFVIVVLSSDFLQKNWPQRELNSVLNREASEGVTRVLPLVVGSKEQRATIMDTYTLLNDKLHMRWPEDKEKLVGQIKVLFDRKNGKPVPFEKVNVNPPLSFTREIYIPTKNARPSMKSKRVFQNEGFDFLRNYFQMGVKKLNKERDDLEAIYEEFAGDRFIASMFSNELKISNCKIWKTDNPKFVEIAFSRKFKDEMDDFGYHESLSVADNSLLWKPSGMHSLSTYEGDPLALDHEAASAYLWHLFLSPLEVEKN